MNHLKVVPRNLECKGEEQYLQSLETLSRGLIALADEQRTTVKDVLIDLQYFVIGADIVSHME